MSAAATTTRARTGVLALACLAGAAFLWSARGAERDLARASELRAAGQLTEARDLAGGLDAPAVRGRAAHVAALAAFQAGDAPGSRQRLRRAARRRPNDWRIRRDLAIVHALLGDRRAARTQIERALELNPGMTVPSAFLVRER